MPWYNDYAGRRGKNSLGPPSSRQEVELVAVSKAQQKAVHKYVRENYDRQEVTFAKGKKAIIKAHAEARGESVNAFINRAIDETMERDSA